jgi:hypothetical protein
MRKGIAPMAGVGKKGPKKSPTGTFFFVSGQLFYSYASVLFLCFISICICIYFSDSDL